MQVTIRTRARDDAKRSWLRLYVAALLGCVSLAVLLWPWLRSTAQALAVLLQVGNQPVPVALRLLTTGPVVVHDVVVPGSAGAIHAREYVPLLQPGAPGLVVVHGVHHLGMDEPRLVAFARAMASCGLRVLTPELPGIKDYRVSPESIVAVGEATRWYAAQTGAPVGVLGLSFSGGLALVAATRPEYRDAFRFVLAVGAQAAMDHVATFYQTGAETRPDGTVERLAPHEYGSLVLEYEHLEDFVPPQDLAAVRTVLRLHLYEDEPAEQAARAGLTPAQQQEVTALTDSTSAATRARVAEVAARHADELQALSPHGRLATITVPVYLLHGAADNIIPSAETLWLASELPAQARRGVLISPGLSHLDMEGQGPGWADQMRLLAFFTRVMHNATAPAAGR